MNQKTAIRSSQLGLFTLTALVAGNMIGSGIFSLPASLARYGTISLVAWALTALGAILLALVFCRLSLLIPKSGGPYTYCREAFGDFVGFVVAFNYWVAVWVGNAAIAIAFTGYLASFFPSLALPSHALLCNLAVVWWLTAVNLVGLKEAGFMQNVLTVLKLLPLLLVIFFGIWKVQPSVLIHQFNVSEFSDWTALTDAAALTMWSFIGLESATVPSENAVDPERNIPRATVLGTLIAALVYLLGAVVVMGLIPMEHLAEDIAPFVTVGRQLLGETGAKILATGAVLSALGALNGWTLLQGQIPMAAARDGVFPKMFARTSKNGIPAFSIIISSVLVSILLFMNGSQRLTDQFKVIILLATLSSLIVYFMSALACISVSLHHNQNRDRKLGFTVAILALLYAFWSLAGAGETTVFYGSLLFFGGMPLYLWVQAQRLKSQQAP